MKQIALDNHQLRKFGLTLCFGLIGIFGVLAPFFFQKNFPVWPWILGGFFLFFSLTKPIFLNFIYIPWMKLGSILGWINTRLILGIIFFILITPMSMVLRFLGKDPMYRKYDRECNSYRKLTIVQNSKHMEKPF